MQWDIYVNSVANNIIITFNKGSGDNILTLTDGHSRALDVELPGVGVALVPCDYGGRVTGGPTLQG